MYTVAITKSGQMTLPKELRLFLGVDDAKRISIEKRKDEVVIKKRMSDEEFLAGIDAIHAKYGSKTKNLPDAVEAVREFRDGKNAEVLAKFKGKYA